MLSIDHYNLRSFDLNLFLAFDAMMIERNVTRAAKRLRVQQPAMSHSLSMLRMLLQDELFVRSGNRMEPTPYALQIAAQVRRFLAQAQDALSFRVTFDPSSERRTFRMAMTPHLEALLVPELLSNMRISAPGVRLSVREADRRGITDMLEEGRAEIGAGLFDAKPTWFCHETLFHEPYVCCYNGKLLNLNYPLSAEQYFELPHALISTKENPLGCLDRAFADHGKTPNVLASAAHFFSVAAIAARAPILATLPAIAATRYAPIFGLTVSPLPIKLSFSPTLMLWHSRLEKDEGILWLRARLREISASLFSSGVGSQHLRASGLNVIEPGSGV